MNEVSSDKCETQVTEMLISLGDINVEGWLGIFLKILCNKNNYHLLDT
jgi:hypothetical protein